MAVGEKNGVISEMVAGVDAGLREDMCFHIAARVCEFLAAAIVMGLGEFNDG